ncbi:MAG: polysaccharide pyruvyl transferase family protein [Candidatus Nanopelagicales bacterium]
MRILVLWADGVSSNLGLRALGAGTEALLRRIWPESDIQFHNYGARVTPVRVGSVKSAVKERITGRGRLVTWLAGFDLVVDTRSGDSFSDIYGVSRLTTMSLMADAVNRAGVPLVIAPQTVGPFGTPTGRLLGWRALRRADVVMVRDSLSARVAADMGRSPDVVATDVVFALPEPKVTEARDLLLNVSGLLWADNPHVPSAQYRENVRRMIRELTTEGRQVTLLAHVLDSPSPDNDVPALRTLAEEFRGLVDVVVPKDLDQVRAVVASANLTLGSRMHACLNSLSVGTPAIPLAYSRKFVPLLQDIGWDRSVDLRESSDPVADAIGLMSDVEGLARDVRTSVTRARRLLVPVEDALRALA